MTAREVRIAAGSAILEGTWAPAGDGSRLVLFAHGSGSSRHSPRNRSVAEAIHGAGVGTLLFDLLTREEEAIDRMTAELRFDIPLLASRLEAATAWVDSEARGAPMAIGYFGASTGAAAALIAASHLGARIGAVVSRGGRPDLAGAALPHVVAPTLLIVGERDRDVMALNEQALAQLRCEKHLARVPHATHLFEEPGTLEEVSRLATAWFARHLAAPRPGPK